MLTTQLATEVEVSDVPAATTYVARREVTYPSIHSRPIPNANQRTDGKRTPFVHAESSYNELQSAPFYLHHHIICK